MGGSDAAATAAAAAATEAAVAAAVAEAEKSAEMPSEVFAYAQQQTAVENERNTNVMGLSDLLLVGDDDRGEVPALYQAESDADDIDFLLGACNGEDEDGEEGGDESLRSLEELLR